MTEPTQEEHDAWSARIFDLISPHYARLRREVNEYRRDHLESEIRVPAHWDELKIGPRLGSCFGVPVVANAGVSEPVVRMRTHLRPPVIDTVAVERLAQRTAALGRVARENELLRAALLRVLEVADVEIGVVGATEVHDAIGHELISGLQSPPVKVEWGTPNPASRKAYLKALEILAEEQIPSAFRRPRVEEMPRPQPRPVKDDIEELVAWFEGSERERITRSDD